MQKTQQLALRGLLGGAAAVAAAALTQVGPGVQSTPTNYGKVPRRLAKAPKLNSPEPLHFMVLLEQDTPLWVIFDTSSPERPPTDYDRAYIDMNADGDFLDEGEVREPDHAGWEDLDEEYGGGRQYAVFWRLGDFVNPVTGQAFPNAVTGWIFDDHEPGFLFTVEPDPAYGGEEPGQDLEGRPRAYNARAYSVGTTPETAPILPIGDHHRRQTRIRFAGESEGAPRLTRKSAMDNDLRFEAVMDGDRPGVYTALDYAYIDPEMPLEATLWYRDGAGRMQRQLYKLRERC